MLGDKDDVILTDRFYVPEDEELEENDNHANNTVDFYSSFDSNFCSSPNILDVDYTNDVISIQKHFADRIALSQYGNKINKW